MERDLRFRMRFKIIKLLKLSRKVCDMLLWSSRPHNNKGGKERIGWGGRGMGGEGREEGLMEGKGREGG
jgi:hypothetical protein